MEQSQDQGMYASRDSYFQNPERISSPVQKYIRWVRQTKAEGEVNKFMVTDMETIDQATQKPVKYYLPEGDHFFSFVIRSITTIQKKGKEGARNYGTMYGRWMANEVLHTKQTPLYITFQNQKRPSLVGLYSDISAEVKNPNTYNGKYAFQMYMIEYGTGKLCRLEISGDALNEMIDIQNKPAERRLLNTNYIVLNNEVYGTGDVNGSPYTYQQFVFGGEMDSETFAMAGQKFVEVRDFINAKNDRTGQLYESGQDIVGGGQPAQAPVAYAPPAQQTAPQPAPIHHQQPATNPLPPIGNVNPAPAYQPSYPPAQKVPAPIPPMPQSSGLPRTPPITGQRTASPVGGPVNQSVPGVEYHDDFEEDDLPF